MKSKLRLMLFMTLGLLIAIPPVGAIELDAVMNDDPPFVPCEIILIFSPKLKTLWLDALDQPESELKRQAAEAIAEAHRRGMPGLKDTAAPLIATLEAKEPHPDVALAGARALIALDAKSSAAILFRHARAGSLDMALTVEPTLAKWNYQPARTVWLKRLDEERTSTRRLMLAIECVSTVGETRAVEPLRRLVLDRRAGADVRIAAARALGVIRTEGLESLAQRLAKDKSTEAILDRLAAAYLIAHHSGESAVERLLETAVDPEPAVVAVALERLLAIDPALVRPINDQIASSRDARVRHLAARILVGQHTSEAVTLLGPMLDDPHPDVRRYVADSLVVLAADEKLDGSVRTSITQELATDHPYGLEQAALVVGMLDHEPAADRLVELLDCDIPRAYIAAAWALCRLAVPETAPEIFDKVRRETESTRDLNEKLQELMDANPAAPALDPAMYSALNPMYDQMFFLIQAMGVLRHKEADPLMRQYIPKPPLPSATIPPFVETTKQENLRVAAIWTLGHLNADAPDDPLARALWERMNDAEPNNPESIFVQRQSAVTLGRMRHEGSLPTLEKYLDYTAEDGVVSEACAWSIARITGRPIEHTVSRTREIHSFGWFLEPLSP